jgi:hypothetical protein
MLPRAGWWGDARLCVAQFLANLWQGPCMAVYGTSVGAIVRQPRPQATGTSGALLSSDDYGVERRANGEASSVMARAALRERRLMSC